MRCDAILTLTGQWPRETSRLMGVCARSEPRRDPRTRFRRFSRPSDYLMISCKRIAIPRRSDEEPEESDGAGQE
ncbi:hypothetical protein Taro_040715 [Colocasia esculenta]|uniref:Uncharacterized protein n=1 Tax=Colocasia esculenta TaxID=4460 RepID=A0A843WMP3_COLES|nr:hypothetical protein [Colocasia esculenta]